MLHYIAKHLLHPFCSRAARPRQGLPPCKMTGVPQLAAGWWWFCHEQTIAGAKGPCHHFPFSRCKSLAFSVSNCAAKKMLVKYMLNFKIMANTQWRTSVSQKQLSTPPRLQLSINRDSGSARAKGARVNFLHTSVALPTVLCSRLATFRVTSSETLSLLSWCASWHVYLSQCSHYLASHMETKECFDVIIITF